MAGLDEAGRGPLAGPVVAAAVVLGPFADPRLDDSKKLAPARRELLYGLIVRHAAAWAVGVVDHATVDRVNPLEASRRAMRLALLALPVRPDYLLLDAVSLEGAGPQLPLVHGDALSASIAAASILAKVTRDRLMRQYDVLYPGYGFARHKGYGTALHLARLASLGPCPIHRLSYAPLGGRRAR